MQLLGSFGLFEKPIEHSVQIHFLHEIQLFPHFIHEPHPSFEQLPPNPYPDSHCKHLHSYF